MDYAIDGYSPVAAVVFSVRVLLGPIVSLKLFVAGLPPPPPGWGWGGVGWGGLTVTLCGYPPPLACGWTTSELNICNSVPWSPPDPPRP